MNPFFFQADGRTFRIFGLSAGFLTAFIGSAALFMLAPQIDLRISSWFYDPARRFPLSRSVWLLALYYSVEILTAAIAAGLIGLGIWTAVIRKAAFGLGKKQIVYLLLVLAIGPGIVVNYVFKDHWGRARPVHIKEFGGQKEFAPAFVISDQSPRNGSFVSGHASMGFYIFAFGWTYARRRRRIFGAAAAYGSLVGLGRIMQGGHFFSDVVFAFFFVYSTAAVLYAWMFKQNDAEDFRT